MFHVTLALNGMKFYLRSTVWTADEARATSFETEDAAKAGLLKAKQFMKAKDYKAAVITPVTVE